MDLRPFPIMGNATFKDVPWWLAESCSTQLWRNHGQSVRRLSERGGLDVLELAAALRGVGWLHCRDITEDQAVMQIQAALNPAPQDKEGQT